MTTTAKAFRVLGTTDDVTTCELCGRENLKGTIALDAIDAEGNLTGNVVYYGSDCGARAAGWTQKEIRAHAKDADRARWEAEQAAREEKDRARQVAFCAWVAERYGVSITQSADLWDHRDVIGKRPIAVCMEWEAVSA